MDLPADGIDGDLHAFVSNGVKQADLGVHNPVKKAPYLHEASKSTCTYLTSIMVDGDYFSIDDHCRSVKEVCVEAYKARLLQ